MEGNVRLTCDQILTEAALAKKGGNTRDKTRGSSRVKKRGKEKERKEGKSSLKWALKEK